MAATACNILQRFASGTKGNMKKAVDLKGVFSAVATPFTESGDIDHKKFESNIIKWEKEASLKGYCLGGSNGEVNTLSVAERVSLVAAARKLTSPDKVIIGGAYAESTRQVIETSKELSKAGADAIMVLIPFYFAEKMSDDLIRRHFEAVADASPVPVIIYNNPGVSKIDIPISTLTVLARHENIQAVKDLDIRKMAYLSILTKDLKLDILAALAGTLVPALQLGCSGGMFGLTNVLCEDICKIYKLFHENKLNEALELQKRVVAAELSVGGPFGVPGVKAGMDLMGYEGGYCRAPLQSLPKESVESIKQALKRYDFL